MEGKDLSAADRAKTDKLLANPLDFPDEFRKWVLDWLGQNLPPIPVTQLLGFVQTRAYTASDVATQEPQSSSSYARLATTGPIITGLNDGTYVVFFGCEMGMQVDGGGGSKGWASLSVNGATPTDGKAVRAYNGGTRIDVGWRADSVTCGAGPGNNTIELLYRSSLGQEWFARRWMHAIRIA